MARRPIADVVTRVIMGVLLAGEIAVGLTTLAAADGRRDDDVTRFFEIATRSGEPYRDFQVEYTPLQTVLIEQLAGETVEDTYRRVVILAVLLHTATFVVMLWGWGAREAQAYLLLCVPLLPFLFVRVDLLSVLAAASGMAFLSRHRGIAAGSALAIGVLAKLWPGAIAPALLRARSRSGIWAFTIACAAGLGAWLLHGGGSSVGQVVTLRGATGWQFESTVGSILWAAGGDLRWEAGALRVGTLPIVAYPLISLVGAVVVAAAWLRRRAPGVDPAGVRSLVTVTAVVTLSPLFSLQYAIWLVPWTAIALAEGGHSRRYAMLGATAIVATGLLALAYADIVSGPWLEAATKVVLLARNGACVALVAAWFADPRPPE